MCMYCVVLNYYIELLSKLLPSSFASLDSSIVYQWFHSSKPHKKTGLQTQKYIYADWMQHSKFLLNAHSSQHCNFDARSLAMREVTQNIHSTVRPAPGRYHQYGRVARYWYIGMARVPHMRNTNMHGKSQQKLSAWL